MRQTDYQTYQRLQELCYHFFENELPQYMERQRGTKEIRHQQISMSLHVLWSLFTNRPVVVEGKVGTGKTLAYTFPLLHYSKEKGAPVVVATSSIPLQEQIFKSDLEILKAIGHRCSAIIAKGAPQYLCLANYERNYDKLTNDQRDLIDYWLDETLTGDRSEMPEIDDLLWKKISYNEDMNCEQCIHKFERCNYQEVRREFRSTDKNFIITNHNQLIADLKNRYEGRTSIFPKRIIAVVIDEAHNFEQAAINIECNALNPSKLMDTVSQIHGLERVHREAKIKASQRRTISNFRQVVMDTAKSQTDTTRTSIPEEHLVDVLDQTIAVVKDLKSGLDVLNFPNQREESLSKRIDRSLAFLSAVKDRNNNIVWYEKESKKLVTLPTASLSKVNQYLKRQHDAHATPFIFTSATIASNSSFSYFYHSVGIHPDEWDVFDLELTSPFRYEHQSLLYIANDLPVFNRNKNLETYYEAVDERIFELLTATEGRTLVLYTSHEHMTRSVNKLRPILPWNVLCQSDGNKEHIGQLFKKSVKPSVLFGTGAFWEGFDVPGEKLIHVIIVRLPFASDDPYMYFKREKMKELGKKAFNELALPEMLIKLKQGFGRLIRNANDYGVVSILDSRLKSAHYSPQVLNTLPNAPITSSLDDIKPFIQGKKSWYPLQRDYKRDDVKLPPVVTVEDEWSPIRQPVPECSRVIAETKETKRKEVTSHFHPEVDEDVPRGLGRVKLTRYECTRCGAVMNRLSQPLRCKNPECTARIFAESGSVYTVI